LSEPTAATATTPSPGPRQLPGAPRWFIGRRTELDTLLRHSDHLPSAVSAGGVVVISAIDGMAGVGKTALALHAAHRLAERFNRRSALHRPARTYARAAATFCR